MLRPAGPRTSAGSIPVAGVGDLALSTQRDPFGGGGAAEDGVLVAGGQGHVQAGLADWAGGTHLLGGVLGGGVVRLGVEQLQVVLPAGGVPEDLEVEGDAAGEAGQVGGQLGRVVGDQAGHRPGRTVGGEGHAASPPKSSTGSGMPARRARSAASSRRYSARWALISRVSATRRISPVRRVAALWQALQMEAGLR